MRQLTFENICIINQMVCEKTGESFQIINKDNILSALSVYNSYFEANDEIAAALFRSLIIAHGFKNGNKRTASIALILINRPVNCDYIEDLSVEISKNGRLPIKHIVNKLYSKTESLVKNITITSKDLNNDITKAPYYKEYMEWNNRWGDKVGTYDEKGMYIPKMDPKTGYLIWNPDWDWDWED